MESFDGILLVPPDRGQILGRAMWKPRYVVVRRRDAQKDPPPTQSFSQKITPSRMQSNTPKPKNKVLSGEYIIAIYKSQDEWEPNYQYPVSSVADCQVQQLAHRKQGPVLPTLVISICDKEKKRRSSRAAGLISSKEQTSTTLWFRTPPDDHHRSLHEWRHFILSRKLPMSPESPVSPTFVNPFASSRLNTSDSQRPSSGNLNRATLSHKTSSQTYSSRDRERPVTYSSESPSLRSKRSDISSPSSAVHPSFIGLPIHGQHYTTVLPTDIPADVPSPAGTLEYPSDMNGWTNSQGMPSAIGSPASGSEHPDRSPGPMDSSSPPGPRETILDRAFQLRCIPGSEREVPGEEKLSSLARFDALMREAEEKRTTRLGPNKAEAETKRSAWDEDNSDSVGEEEDSEDDEDEDEYPRHGRRDRDTIIPPTAQRALEFIAGRHDRPQSPHSPRGSVEYELGVDVDSFPIPIASPPPFRPHTSYTKRRPNMSSRTQSQPQMAPNPAELLSPIGKIVEDSTREKRASNSSVKRLSFTEVTKRLSSTSSLLLVQTNGSGGASSRGSTEWDQTSPVPRSSLSPRGAPPNLKGRDLEEWEKRCGWRSSVGVFGTEGGFL